MISQLAIKSSAQFSPISNFRRSQIQAISWKKRHFLAGSNKFTNYQLNPHPDPLWRAVKKCLLVRLRSTWFNSAFLIYRLNNENVVGKLWTSQGISSRWDAKLKALVAASAYVYLLKRFGKKTWRTFLTHGQQTEVKYPLFWRVSPFLRLKRQVVNTKMRTFQFIGGKENALISKTQLSVAARSSKTFNLL